MRLLRDIVYGICAVGLTIVGLAVMDLILSAIVQGGI